MRTPTTQQSLEAERVWGVEALDPLQQRAWAETVWRQIQAACTGEKPLVLVYSPTAERAAIRALNTLARCARLEESPPVVFLSAPDSLPVLEPAPPHLSSLHLIHRASRFLNWREWLAEIKNSPLRRIVITVPQEEAGLVLAEAPGEIIKIPEVEENYCEQAGQKILTKFFGDESTIATPLSRWEQILVEAGIAEVALPVSLLARHLGLDRLQLIETMQTSRLKDILYWLAPGANQASLVAFRGSWLAKKIAPAAVAGEYHALFALLADTDLQSPQERSFLLALLAALRAQNCAARAELLQQRYAGLFAQARRLVELVRTDFDELGRTDRGEHSRIDGCLERQAWAYLERQSNPTSTPAKI